MLKGLLVYEYSDYLKNQWFAQEFIRQAEAYGLSIKLLFVKANYDFSYMQDIAFIINRSRLINVAIKASQQGIRCFNQEKACLLGNDKWEMYQVFKANGIKVLPTYLEAIASYPQVVKERYGHGGSQVYLVNNESELNQLSLVQPIYQPYFKCYGDVRSILLGKDLLISLIRTNDGFKHNVSYGAKTKLFELDNSMIKQIELINELVEFDLGAVDILVSDEDYYINEIEDSVGVRSVYNLSDIDVVAKYLAYIRNSI